MTKKSYEYSGPCSAAEVILTHKYPVLWREEIVNRWATPTQLRQRE